MPNLPTLADMMKAGLHFGHSQSKWNPKMAKYIFTVRNGVHIFNLEETQKTLEAALNQIQSVAAKGGVILFVGTKKQAKKIVEKYAQEAGMPYMVERWIGGAITNFVEIHRLVKKLESLEKQAAEPDYETKYTKWERGKFSEEMGKLLKNIGGIRAMKKVPDLIYIAGSKQEKTAVREAITRRVPSVGIVDTNANPDEITYPIAGNDDAVKSIEMITRLVAEAVMEGKKQIPAASPANLADNKPSTS